MMPSKIHQLGPTFIVISWVGLAVLLFYIAYCLCKRCAKIDPDSYEDEDYIEQPSSAIFKVSVCFFSSNWHFLPIYSLLLMIEVILSINLFVFRNEFLCQKKVARVWVATCWKSEKLIHKLGDAGSVVNERQMQFLTFRRSIPSQKYWRDFRHYQKFQSILNFQ